MSYSPANTSDDRSPMREWLTAALQENSSRCLQEGASHTLLKAAGHTECWKCGVTLTHRISVKDIKHLLTVHKTEWAAADVWLKAVKASRNNDDLIVWLESRSAWLGNP